MKRRERGGKTPVWQLVLIQLLLTGLVLCVFALFHHVIPRIRLRTEGLPGPIGTVERRPSPMPAPDATVTPDGMGAEEPVFPEDPLPAEEPVPETWRERFAEQFSDEVVWTENSYQSPDISITIQQVSHPESFPNMTYYVADIYLADLDCFRTGFPAQGTFDSGRGIARANDAVLAINGDSMLTQRDGFLIRNGQIYKQQPNSGDLCVMYYDGSMEIVAPDAIDVDDILSRGPFQIWQFGPSLLDGNGSPLEIFNVSPELRSVHPRTAIGYYEPGHYCFVVIDGRQGDYSDGADIADLARVMSGLGCKLAYNLDGGASSIMIFHGEVYDSPCNGGRYINDMLVISEPVKEGEDG